MPTLEHIIVLMLENRSFDHMLGFLDHPNPAYPRLTGAEGNRLDPADPASREFFVTAKAEYTLKPGPDHSHESVMNQLLGPPPQGATKHTPPYHPNNSGFVMEHERLALGKGLGAGHGKEIMRCFAPGKLPVLATLAKEFCVCTRWFCSVPGETWPNRNYAHAGTSHRQVNIKKRLYLDKTIFEQLDDVSRSWRIFHQGPPQAWAFPALWGRPFRQRWGSIDRLIAKIETDDLPNYSFVEPNHGYTSLISGPSNSQHPGSNTEDGDDFLAGERLIARIYEALRGRRAVFEKTLFVITYDEHGGFYDHVPPPSAVPPGDGRARNGFDFDLLGPRVPAVLVSPWIPAGTIDDTIYDHSSIVASVRAAFAPTEPELTKRDGSAEVFLHNLRLTSARTSLPALEPLTRPLEATAAQPARRELDEFQLSLLDLADAVERKLEAEEREPLAAISSIGVEGLSISDEDELPSGPSRAAVSAESLAVRLDGIGERFRASFDPDVIEVSRLDGSTLVTREDLPAMLEVQSLLDTGAAADRVSVRTSDERVFRYYGDGRSEELDLERGITREIAVELGAAALSVDDLLDSAELRARAEGRLRATAAERVADRLKPSLQRRRSEPSQ